MAFRVGIDLGTTNSVVSYMKNGRPEVVANLQGEYWTPSVVQEMFGQVKVGKEAKENMPYAPGATIWSIKRFIGRSPGDQELERARRLVSYRVEDPPPGKTDMVVYLGDKPSSPIEISAMILQKLVEAAEVSLGQKPTEAVITVPAYFSERQKEATRQAGKKAGLKVLRILDEPTAAALAYGIDRDPSAEKNLLVFDLGGGTFDVSVLMLTGGQLTTMKITGDNFLGGDDFDNVIVDRLLEEIRNQMGQDMTHDAEVRAHVKKAAESAKIALSAAQVHQVDLFIPPNPKANRGLVGVSTRIDRNWFDLSSRRLVDRAMNEVRRALTEAGLSVSDVHHVLLVGGSSRIPQVQSAVESFFGKERVSRELNPMLCVAQGAAILADTIVAGKEDETLTRCTAKPLGVELHDGTFDPIMPEGTYYPVEEPLKQSYKTSGKNQRQLIVSVFEGHASRARDNEWMGDVTIDFTDGLPENTNVLVSFRLDKDACLFVSVDVAGRPNAVRDSRVERQNRPKPPDPKKDDGPKSIAPETVLNILSSIQTECRRILPLVQDSQQLISSLLGRMNRAIESGDEKRASTEANAIMDELWAKASPLMVYLVAKAIERNNADPVKADRVRRMREAFDRTADVGPMSAIQSAYDQLQSAVDAAVPAGGGASSLFAGLKKA